MFGKDKDKTQHVENMYIQQLEETPLATSWFLTATFLLLIRNLTFSTHDFGLFANMASHIMEQLHSVWHPTRQPATATWSDTCVHNESASVEQLGFF